MFLSNQFNFFKNLSLFILCVTVAISCNDNPEKENKEIEKNEDNSSIISDNPEQKYDVPEEDKAYFESLKAELKLIAENEKLDENCNQRCMACRQQARYRLSACLRTASNETQRSQCRSNYQSRVANCNNNNIVEGDSLYISNQDKVLVDILWDDLNIWKLYSHHPYVGCGKNVLGRYRSKSDCNKAAKRMGYTSWCCKEKKN